MWCTLTLDGVPLGQVELTGSPRGIGQLIPLSGYASSGFSDIAKRLGLAVRLLRSRRIQPKLVARTLAAVVAQFANIQDRLGLTAIEGDHIAIVHMVVAEFPQSGVPIVVAQLREQAAPVGALPLGEAGGPGERSRPAA